MEIPPSFVRGDFLSLLGRGVAGQALRWKVFETGRLPVFIGQLRGICGPLDADVGVVPGDADFCGGVVDAGAFV